MKRPELLARFQLGKDGQPEFLEDPTGLRHYKILLDVKDAPTDTASATYHLHETFWDPVREVIRESGAETFEEPITSYGDFDVVAMLSGSAARMPKIQEKLTDALTRYYEESADTEQVDQSSVAAAIEALRIDQKRSG